MSSPKIKDGQKLSIILSSSDVLRVKHEAIDRGIYPSEVVSRALAAWWNRPAPIPVPIEIRKMPELPTVPKIPKTVPTPKTGGESNVSRQLLAFVEELLDDGHFTQGELMDAVGASGAAFRSGWRATGHVPEKHIQTVVGFLQSKGVSAEEIHAATNRAPVEPPVVDAPVTADDPATKYDLEF